RLHAMPRWVSGLDVCAFAVTVLSAPALAVTVAPRLTAPVVEVKVTLVRLAVKPALTLTLPSCEVNAKLPAVSAPPTVKSSLAPRSEERRLGKGCAAGRTRCA